jgi:4-hydroxybutyryl-CoA dehydratase / vinylacetyl-CoA-Delta-isomerase
MRTGEEFLASLTDGRYVQYKGEQVRDIAAHPALSVCVNHALSAYGPTPRGLSDADWIVQQQGGPCSVFYAVPRVPADLLRRAAAIEALTAQQWGQFNIIKVVGSDVLFALVSLRDRLAADGTAPGAAEAVDGLLHRCQISDIATAAAVTDAKGNRSLRPGQQRGGAAYLRIVDRDAKGIVVRGVKLHTTSAPVADELVVLPTRAMAAGEEDFAVSFAVPTNAPGLRMLCRPVREELDPFDNPVSARAFEIETTTIFDNVFVPWERVFLAGACDLAGELARRFATFHRFTGLSYKPPLAELLLAATRWIVADNGLANKSELAHKLAEIINYITVIKSTRTASAVTGRLIDGGVFCPDPVATNAGKFYFASRFHDIAGLCQELAGGLMVTAPSVADLRSADAAWLSAAFDGACHDSHRRLIAMNILRDLTAGELGGYNYVAALHGEGSLGAQLTAALHEYDFAEGERRLDDLVEAVRLDKRLAHPVY